MKKGCTFFCIIKRVRNLCINTNKGICFYYLWNRKLKLPELMIHPCMLDADWLFVTWLYFLLSAPCEQQFISQAPFWQSMWQDNNEPGSTVNRLQWEEVFRYLCNQLCSSWTCMSGLLVVNLLNSGVLQITWRQTCWEVLRVSWPLCGYLRKCSLNKEKFGSTACVRNHGSDGLLGHVYLTNFISCQKFCFGSSVPWCAAVPVALACSYAC